MLYFKNNCFCSFVYFLNLIFIFHFFASLHLPRAELDNPHKASKNSCFRETFAVDVNFEDVGDGVA